MFILSCILLCLIAEWMDPSAANNATAAPADEEALKMEAFLIAPPAAPTDITLGLVPSAEGLQMALHADGNLFAMPTVKRMISRLYGILESATNDVQTPLKDQAKLSGEGLEEVMAISCGEERTQYVSAPLMHEAFEHFAVASPNQRCLCFEGEWLSYGEVSERVTQMVKYLTASGVKPGMVVGIMMDRSFELVVSILAVFKAGGCYLPCDPSYPDDRLAVYFEDADAKIVLVQEKYSERAASMVGAGVDVVDVAATLAAAAPKKKKQASSVHGVGPEDPAYIIFTSGSTGRPKGVVIPHRGLRDLMPYLVDQFKLGTSVEMSLLSFLFCCFYLSCFVDHKKTPTTFALLQILVTQSSLPTLSILMLLLFKHSLPSQSALGWW
jgi:non-ribosomal peptide synthetase component F